MKTLCGILVCTMATTLVAEKLDRGLVVLSRGDGSVYIGWRLLDSDPPDVGFHLYRQFSPDAKPERLTARPLSGGTDFVDSSVPSGDLGDLIYTVRAVISGKEGDPSAGTTVRNRPGGPPFVRIRFDGEYVAQKVTLGDLDGDGRYDYVIKQPDFNTDPYQHPGYWKKSEDTYKIEAYNANGRRLWRYDMGWAIEEGIWYSPYVVYDLDGDGKTEVYAKAGEGDPRDADGRVTSGPEYLVKIDGETGKVLRKIPWPDRSGYEDYNYYCRNMLGVAYLDGKRPHLIVERGTYTQIKVEAYGPDLEPVWKWNSRNEKEKYNSQGMHGMHAADVDDDGRDEVILGSAVLDDNGKGLWTRGVGHPDGCHVGDIDPARPGLEIFCAIEPSQKNGAVCLVDARTGEKIWGNDEPTKHVHSTGMAADIIAEHPGQECYAGEQNKSAFWLFTADGRRIGDKELGGLSPHAAWWDADPQKEFITKDGDIGDFEGKPQTRIEGKLIGIADCLGDWREELITSLPGELRIYSTTIPAGFRRVCLMQDRLYRLDVVMASMGYWHPPQLSRPLR